MGWNYGVKQSCPLCLDHDDTQEHLLNCLIINSRPVSINLDNNTHILHEQMKKLQTSIRKRKILLNKKSKTATDTNLTAKT